MLAALANVSPPQATTSISFKVDNENAGEVLDEIVKKVRKALATLSWSIPACLLGDLLACVKDTCMQKEGAATASRLS